MSLPPVDFDKYAAQITAATHNYPELVRLRNEFAMSACFYLNVGTPRMDDFARSYAELEGQARTAIVACLYDPQVFMRRRGEAVTA